MLDVFCVRPDYDLDVMMQGQTLIQSSSRILAGLERVLTAERPDIVLVQGDTTTTFLGALASFYLRIPVGHVEAGLRTGDRRAPFPEEMNRLLTGRLATLHFAATSSAVKNLTGEGVPLDSITLTGNTGIDAVLYMRDRLKSGAVSGLDIPALDPRRKLILVTAHRRESFGEGIESICRALVRLSRRSDTQIVFPVHPNPNVRAAASRLSGLSNVILLDPLDYPEFVSLMAQSYLLLTDSGGIQEEGPSLGKPILVMRDKTERPEAVAAGTAVLVGVDENKIVEGVERLLNNPDAYRRMTKVHNPYGDGRACERIAAAIRRYFAVPSPAGFCSQHADSTVQWRSL